MNAFIPLLAGAEVFFIMGAVAIFLVGGMIWSHIQEKKRRETLGQIANDLQLDYTPDDVPQLQQAFSGFKLFSQGRSRKVRNVLYGETDEVEISIFDYQYTTGGGKNSHTHKQTVAGLRSNDLAHIPDFLIRPESMVDKIGGAIGFQDIDFESHPGFSGMFVLQGPDEDAIRSFFNSYMLEFFENRPGTSVQATSGRMVFFRAGRRVKPELFTELLGEAYEVFGAMVDGRKA